MTHLNNEIALTLKLEGEAFTSWDGLDEAITSRIADHFISDHKMNLRERVDAIIHDRVTAAVEARVDAFLSKPIPALTRYGEPIPDAPTRTLSEMIADAADAAMTEFVSGHDGKPTRERNPFGGRMTRLEWLVAKVASEGVASAAEKAARDVNAEAKAAVKKKVADSIAALLAGR